jgi:hypothetical protein
MPTQIPVVTFARLRLAVAVSASLLSTAACTPLVARGLAAGGGRAAQAAVGGRAMWIWYLRRSDGGDLAAIAARARQAGVRTLIVKSSDGANYWPQFSRGLVHALHADGLHVCAWQYVYGSDPAGEAAQGSQAVANGAECLVIDAEAEYEGRYAAAQSYMRHLRAAVGRSYPVVLSSFPYVDYHPAFPYSVFLGPGGAQFDMPQMYWRDISSPPATIFHHTYTYNRIYKRAIIPLGQSHGSPLSAEIADFRGLAVRYRARGIAWWDYAWTSFAGLWPAISGAFAPPAAVEPLGEPALHQGDKGDHVLWLQEHLARLYGGQLTTGLFGAQTAANVSAFQARRGLPRTGITDRATWRALLHIPPISVSWTASGARTARRSTGAPASASLRAVAYEIPLLGADRVAPNGQHAEP